MNCLDLEIDETEYRDSSRLWRRIRQHHVVLDDNLGGHRPSSAAFTNTTKTLEMSVDIEEIAREIGRSPEDCLSGYPHKFIAAITTEVARDNGQVVRHLPEDENQAHGGVIGAKNKRIQRNFAKKAEWIIAPSTSDD